MHPSGSWPGIIGDVPSDGVFVCGFSFFIGAVELDMIGSVFTAMECVAAGISSVDGVLPPLSPSSTSITVAFSGSSALCNAGASSFGKMLGNWKNIKRSSGS